MKLLIWLFKVLTDKKARAEWWVDCPLVLCTWGSILGSVAGAVVGTGMSYGLNSGNKGGGGAYQSITELPQWSWNEGFQKRLSDFYSNQIQGLSEGQPPPYLSNLTPEMKAGLQRDLKKTYYGRPGERGGLIGGAYERGAITGLGSKATQAQAGKVEQDYAEKSQDIDRFIQELLFQGTHQAAMTLPGQAMGLSQGPPTIYSSFQTPQSPNYMGEALSDMAGDIPWKNIFQNWGTGAGNYNSSYPGANYGAWQANLPTQSLNPTNYGMGTGQSGAAAWGVGTQGI